MNKGQVVSWFQEAATMLQSIGQLEEGVAKMKGNLELAHAAGDANQVMTLTTQLQQFNTIRDKVQPAVLTRTKTSDLEHARQFLTDLQLKMEQAEEQYRLWRKATVAFEYIGVMNEFAESPDSGSGNTRAEWEQRLTELKQRYEAALTLCADHIPSSVRLIHV